MEWIWVASGGACGALARFAISRLITIKWGGPFPLGTWFVNVSGSFLLGLLLPFASILSDTGFVLLTVGVLGSFTTFSTFSVETVQLWQQHSRRKAGIYVAASVMSGLTATAFGLWAGGGIISYV